MLGSVCSAKVIRRMVTPTPHAGDGDIIPVIHTSPCLAFLYQIGTGGLETTHPAYISGRCYCLLSLLSLVLLLLEL